jgi:4-amino-4-deoxy-L-arabinose transferase-like glycosyltransferase
MFLPERRHAAFYGFIPLFLFFTLPECTKKIAYPLLDTTLALFTSFAVYFLCRAMHYGRHFFLWTVLGGLFIVMGILTKGPVGLFPLITPVIYYMVYRDPDVFRKMFSAMGILTIVLVAAICALYIYTPSRLFFTEYLQHQVFASIRGEREKASTFLNHFSILGKMATQLLPMIVITIIVSLFTPKDRSKRMFFTARPFLFFMGIGLAASLPIAISAKHHTFYLIPSFVFFTLAFSCYISNLIPAGILTSKKRSNSILLFVLVAAITTIFILSLAREKRYYKKHQAFLIQMEEMAPWLSSTKCLGTSEALLHQRGDICCYMERYFQIELLPSTDKCDFYLAFDTDSLPVTDAKLVTQTHGFKLYTIP